jgi:hypothetical protein
MAYILTFNISHRKPSIYFLYRTGGPVITKTSSSCSTGSSSCSTGFAAGAGSNFTAGTDFAPGVNLTGGPVITKTSSVFSTGFDTGARSNGVDVGRIETGFGVGFGGAPEPVVTFAMLRDARTPAYRGAGPSKTNASDSALTFAEEEAVAGTGGCICTGIVLLEAGGCNGGGAGAGTELETMEVVRLEAGGCICVGGGARAEIELEAVLTSEKEPIGEGGSGGPPSEYPEIRKS